MLLISLDTSQEVSTITIGRDGTLLAEYATRHRMDLLRRLLPNVDRLLTDAGLTVRDLDGVVVALGPGSFTGLRIGVTTAKALAYVLEKPLVGIGTLDAMARGAAPAAVDLICPMIFARADEVYWSLFDASGNERVRDYAVSPVEEVLGELLRAGGRVLVCGTGASRNRPAIENRGDSRVLFAADWHEFARGAALLELGAQRLAAGHSDDSLSLAPLYVRKPTPVVRLESGKLDV